MNKNETRIFFSEIESENLRKVFHEETSNIERNKLMVVLVSPLKRMIRSLMYIRFSGNFAHLSPDEFENYVVTYLSDLIERLEKNKSSLFTYKGKNLYSYVNQTIFSLMMEDFRKRKTLWIGNTDVYRKGNFIIKTDDIISDEIDNNNIYYSNKIYEEEILKEIFDRNKLIDAREEVLKHLDNCYIYRKFKKNSTFKEILDIVYREIKKNNIYEKAELQRIVQSETNLKLSTIAMTIYLIFSPRAYTIQE